ncbi:MAG: hypothetical protein M3680_35600 [Myxococcota bacterium]|nr:hypothetical protein [Myxococcota bacterium]
MRGIGTLLVVLVAACGPPVARNVPQPNTAAAAGIVAGAAAAVTLADPAGAAAKQEQNKVADEKRPQRVKGTVPAAVFDRLEDQQRTGAPGEPVVEPAVAPGSAPGPAPVPGRLPLQPPLAIPTP